MLIAVSWSVDTVLTQWHFLVEVDGSDSIENNPTCQWKVIKSLEWPMLNYIKKMFLLQHCWQKMSGKRYTEL